MRAPIFAATLSVCLALVSAACDDDKEQPPPAAITASAPATTAAAAASSSPPPAPRAHPRKEDIPAKIREAATKPDAAPEAIAKYTSQLLFARGFAEAEPLIRQALEAKEGDFALLSQLDVALNGQDKQDEADKVRAQIINVCHDLLADGEADAGADAGKPEKGSSWVRIMAFTDQHRIHAAELCKPRAVGDQDDRVTTFYQVFIYPLDPKQKRRTLELEMSIKQKKPRFALRERESGAEIAAYGEEKPTIRKLVEDTIAHLGSRK